MVDGGRALQLPLYLIAASELLSIPAENGVGAVLLHDPPGRASPQRRSTARR